MSTAKQPMSILEKLSAAQQELKAPKTKWNEFGKYYYRDNESVLESLKPILSKLNCVVTQEDEMVEVGGRVYVKATTMLVCIETGEHVGNTAFAREAAELKGMTAPQITGGASSFARKYSANGLFLLDDADDPDHPREEATSGKKKVVRTKPAIVAKKKVKIEKGSKNWDKVVAGISRGVKVSALLSKYEFSAEDVKELKELEA